MIKSRANIEQVKIDQCKTLFLSDNKKIKIYDEMIKNKLFRPWLHQVLDIPVGQEGPCFLLGLVIPVDRHYLANPESTNELLKGEISKNLYQITEGRRSSTEALNKDLKRRNFGSSSTSGVARAPQAPRPRGARGAEGARQEEVVAVTPGQGPKQVVGGGPKNRRYATE